LTGTQTLTNKTLTSPVLNTGVSGTAILDEDNMASDSATQLATQQSIKAYVDTEVGSIVSDVVGDTTPQLGGDLDLNSNDITGTGNINITGTIQSSGNITGTLATAAQTNITSVGTLSSLTVSGDATFDTSTLKVDSTNNRVGIGTASPSATLDIESSLPIIHLEDNVGSTARIYNDNGVLGFDADYNQGVAGSAMTFSVDASERMRIDSSGNVGIGTSSPAQSLDTTGKIRIRDGGNTTVPSIQMGASGVDGLSLPTTNTVAFITNSTERMRITSAGNVGIGMTPAPGGSDTVLSLYNSATPRFRLHNSTTGTTASDGGEINMSGSDFILENREAGNVRFFCNNGERMRIDSNGNIAIGGTSASNFSGYVTLDLRDTTGGLIDFSEASAGVFARIQAVVNNSLNINNRQAYPVTFGTNDTERMRIDSNGKVLINSTDSSPRGILNVSGAVSNAVTTVMSFDDMGARGAGTAQAIDFVMGRAGFISEDLCGSIRAVCSASSATTASHGISLEFYTATGSSQNRLLKLNATGSATQFNTDEIPTYGNPSVTNALVIGPTGASGNVNGGLTTACALYNRNGELIATDASLNNTQLTPHNWGLISDGPSEELAWTYWSQRPKTDDPDTFQTINVDMAKVARKVEDLVGEKLVYTENSNMDDHTHQSIIANIQSTLADLTTRIENLEG